LALSSSDSSRKPENIKIYFVAFEQVVVGEAFDPIAFIFFHGDSRHESIGRTHSAPFFWKPGEGVMLEFDWTGAGKAAIIGRYYSYSSPCFLMNEDGGSERLLGVGLALLCLRFIPLPLLCV
jgi:hypothetical protein